MKNIKTSNNSFLGACGVALLGLALVFSSVHSSPASAASFALNGNYRFGTNMLVNTDLTPGTRTGSSNSTTFMDHRFLLRPDVVVDERFSIKSELSFAQLLSTSGNNVASNFGTTLDSRSSQMAGDQMMQVNSLYLRWSSDWGLFRFGRVPKSWGLGLLYDGGEDPLDDFQTLRDRADFQAMLGSLGLRIAYEKGAEGVITNDSDDIDTYELALDYSNAEGDSAVGIMYSRNIRSLQSTAAGGSSHDLSIFAKKRWNKVQLGGEFVSIATQNADATTGFLIQADYLSSSWRLAYDVAYASASNSSTAKFTFNPNYKPFMFLFRHDLGSGVSSADLRSGRGVGSDVVGDGGGGALVNKAHISYEFSDLTLGTDFGFASLNRKGLSGKSYLGFETDLFLSQDWYDNFKMIYAAGLLVPGEAYGASPKAAWGLELKGVLEF